MTVPAQRTGGAAALPPLLFDWFFLLLYFFLFLSLPAPFPLATSWRGLESSTGTAEDWALERRDLAEVATEGAKVQCGSRLAATDLARYSFFSRHLDASLERGLARSGGGGARGARWSL